MLHCRRCLIRRSSTPQGALQVCSDLSTPARRAGDHTQSSLLVVVPRYRICQDICGLPLRLLFTCDLHQCLFIPWTPHLKHTRGPCPLAHHKVVKYSLYGLMVFRRGPALAALGHIFQQHAITLTPAPAWVKLRSRPNILGSETHPVGSAIARSSPTHLVSEKLLPDPCNSLVPYLLLTAGPQAKAATT